MDSNTLGLLMQGVANVTPQSLVMIGVSLMLFWLAIGKGYEPLLLLPIGAGCLLANLPLSPLIADDGMLKVLYDMGIRQRALPAADLHRHRRAHRLRAAAREPAHGAAGRRGAVRHLPHADPGAGAGLHTEGGGVDRHHRRDRRADLDLRLGHSRAAPARPDHRGSVQLHVARADHHAADHAAPDHRARAPDPHAVHAAQDQPAHADAVPDRGDDPGGHAGAVRDTPDRHADARQPDEGVGRRRAAHQGVVAGDRQRR